MSSPLWHRDDIQFPRLLAEIKAVGLTAEQVKALCESMGILPEDLHELLDRAEETFSSIKASATKRQTTCISCGSDAYMEHDRDD